MQLAGEGLGHRRLPHQAMNAPLGIDDIEFVGHGVQQGLQPRLTMLGVLEQLATNGEYAVQRAVGRHEEDHHERHTDDTHLSGTAGLLGGTLALHCEQLAFVALEGIEDVADTHHGLATSGRQETQRCGLEPIALAYGDVAFGDAHPLVDQGLESRKLLGRHALSGFESFAQQATLGIETLPSAAVRNQVVAAPGDHEAALTGFHFEQGQLEILDRRDQRQAVIDGLIGNEKCLLDPPCLKGKADQQQKGKQRSETMQGNGRGSRQQLTHLIGRLRSFRSRPNR